MRSMKRIEKPIILAHTPLLWVRKNIYKVPKETSFPAGFLQIEQQLKTLGYNKHIHYTNDHYILGFWYQSDQYCQIVIYISLANISNMKEFFDYLKTEFPEMKGYSGSMEWQFDICQKFKIPLIKDLQYLDPPKGHFWYKNELHGGLI